MHNIYLPDQLPNLLPTNRVNGSSFSTALGFASGVKSTFNNVTRRVDATPARDCLDFIISSKYNHIPLVMLVETLRPLHIAQGQLYSAMEGIQFFVLSIAQ